MKRLPWLLLLVACASRAGQIQFVDGAQNSTPSPTTIVRLGDGGAPGDTVVVGLTWQTPGTITSLTDNRGDTYVPVSTATSGVVGLSTWSQQLFYAAGIDAGAVPLTLTCASVNEATYIEMVVAEYAGVAPQQPLDAFVDEFGVTTAGGTPTVIDGGELQTRSADELLAVWTVTDLGATGPGAGYTARISAAGDLFEDRFQAAAAATAVSNTDTYNASGVSWHIVAAAFRSSLSADAGTDAGGPSPAADAGQTSALPLIANIGCGCQSGGVGFTLACFALALLRFAR